MRITSLKLNVKMLSKYSPGERLAFQLFQKCSVVFLWEFEKICFNGFYANAAVRKC